MLGVQQGLQKRVVSQGSVLCLRSGHESKREVPLWQRQLFDKDLVRVLHCAQCHALACLISLRCPHDKKCIVCDTWSCAACKIVRGDGDVVAGLAAKMSPNVTIFLDFDRTIASTKCGADPLIGSHSIDASLLSVMNAHR